MSCKKTSLGMQKVSSQCERSLKIKQSISVGAVQNTARPCWGVKTKTDKKAHARYRSVLKSTDKEGESKMSKSMIHRQANERPSRVRDKKPED
jgi:hypothetical protein